MSYTHVLNNRGQVHAAPNETDGVYTVCGSSEIAVIKQVCEGE